MAQLTAYCEEFSHTDEKHPTEVFLRPQPVRIGYMDEREYRRAFVRFQFPEALRGKKVTSATFYFFARHENTFDAEISNYLIPNEKIDFSSLCYSNRPTSQSGSSAAPSPYQLPKSKGEKTWISVELAAGIKGNSDIITQSFFVALGLGFNGSSTGTSSNSFFEADGVESANKPYAVIEYGDATYKIQENSVRPRSGYVDRKKTIQFAWYTQNGSADGSVVVSPCIQKSLFRWRPKGQTSYNEIEIPYDTTSAPLTYIPEIKYSLPANTFSSGEIEFQVASVSLEGVTGTPSDWRTLTTVDSLSTSVAVSPASTYIDGSVENTFTWQHIIDTGTAQTKAQLQTSIDGGQNWIDLITFEGAATSGTVPANTLPGGSILWRVRTYNNDEVAGTWSNPVPLMVYAAPAAPAISNITTSPRPTISWQSTGQEAFEVKFGEWTSGPVFGTAKQFQCPEFLPDGEVTAAVRIQNSLGLWSQWAQAGTTVANQPGEAISLTATPAENGVTLQWETTGNYLYYILYRDGIAIAKTDKMSFTDYLCNQKRNYETRGVLYGEYFTLSETAQGETVVRNAVLSRVEPVQWIPLEGRRGALPSHTVSGERQMSMQYYLGRKKPVAEVSEFITLTHTFEFTLRRDVGAQWDRLAELLGETVVYKDCRGEVVVGTMASLNGDKGRYIDVSFTIVETDQGVIPDA